MIYRKEIVIPDGGDAIVVVLDICSSSDIVGQLLRKGELHRFRALIHKLKERLAEAQMQTIDFQPYKFTGDGWILLFPLPLCFKGTAKNGGALLEVLAGISKWFKQAHYDLIVKYLDGKLPTKGINFGIAAGKLNRDKIFQKNEYFGDPIIIASRLQGAIARKTNAPGYKALITFSAFNSHFKSAVGSASVVGKFDLNLRNVGKTRCRLIKL